MFSHKDANNPLSFDTFTHPYVFTQRIQLSERTI